jgi:probable Rubsico expression protein CbbX
MAARQARRIKPMLWDQSLAADMPVTSWPALLADPARELAWLERYTALGFGLLTDVPITPGAVADVGDRLGYVRKGHLVSVTRDDLVGQYIGHTAPKTKEVLKRAMGGVLFIDEAYYLYRPENERDYGQEAIEILLQVMENQRKDLVVILAGYHDRMETFFQSNPGMRSRIAHHLDFPDYSVPELLHISTKTLEQQNYRFGAGALEAFEQYLCLRIAQPQFANARSVRNALDRARLRQASRLFADRNRVLTAQDLTTIEASDILASRLFSSDAT